jgi:hypothetical protein
MVESDALELIAQEDDKVLAELVSLLVRRRASGFTPVLLVSVNKQRQVISDYCIGRDDAEDLVAFLHHDGLAGTEEVETDLN